MSCPKCPNKPFTNIQEAFRRDKSIQSIVYLVSPETYWEQLESKGEFLAKKLLSEEEQELIIEKDLVQFADQLVDENDKISVTLEYLSDLANIQTSLIHSLKNEKIANLTINIPEGKLKKEDSSKAFKRYFLVKAKTKISSLVELMELKFDLKKTEYEIVFTLITHPFVLNPELTIKDVIYMSYFDRQNPLHMYFTILRKPKEGSIEIVELDKEDEAAAPKDMPRLEKMDTIPLADEPPKLEKVNPSIPDVTANFSTQLINGQHIPNKNQGNNILPSQNGKQNHGVKRKSTVISSPPVSPPALIKEAIDNNPNRNQKFNVNGSSIMPTLQCNGIPSTGTQQTPNNILPNNKISMPTNFTMQNNVAAFNQFVSPGPGGQPRNSLPPNYVYAITNGIPNQVFNTPFIQTPYNMMNCNKLSTPNKQIGTPLATTHNEPKPKKGRRSAESIPNNIMSQQLAQQQFISSIFNGQGNNRPVFLQNDAGQIIGSNGNNIMILHQSSNLLATTGIHPQPQQIKVLPTLAPKINNPSVGKVTKA
ncbi:Hypothetical protein SRAE_1000284900 [Strongyloides ratti]|uniref:Uncharacterized protein n=1 Tax=Strongyloides ratti TaxID=34506 RepID=A0A090L462_STRRB|nr:Hypothetical protein SRAE_1000284900 [Strongyloides ratti]CEF64596.1 Hypothetical protein SRAE_1000284900 [Strongyloides ratti]